MELLQKRDLIASKDELIHISNLKEELKKYLRSSNSISEPVRQLITKSETDNTFLLKYVRGRKQDIHKACASIIRYAEVSCDIYPEMFPSKVPDRARFVFDQKVISVLHHTDREGRVVTVCKMAAWDTSVISMDDITCYGRYIIDALMDYPSMYTGIVFLVNCEGAKLSHAREYSISATKKFINVFWHAYPIPIKGVYYVNLPYFAKPVYSILKPFLPSKLRDRILLSSDVKELHERIPADILPESLGGTLAEDEAMSLSFLELPV